MWHDWTSNGAEQSAIMWLNLDMNVWFVTNTFFHDYLFQSWKIKDTVFFGRYTVIPLGSEIGGGTWAWHFCAECWISAVALSRQQLIAQNEMREPRSSHLNAMKMFFWEWWVKLAPLPHPLKKSIILSFISDTSFAEAIKSKMCVNHWSLPSINGFY